jgi:hypothetical protein
MEYRVTSVNLSELGYPGLYQVFLCITGGSKNHGESFLAILAPSSAGERTVVTLAASSAANLSLAVPLPPEMMAPACPIRLPGGAVTPAI